MGAHEAEAGEMKALAIARVNVKRLLRERSNIFFVFIFPIALILSSDAQFGVVSFPLWGNSPTQV
jgi:hypothetical protein